jgi:hypothetical protein
MTTFILVSIFLVLTYFPIFLFLPGINFMDELLTIVLAMYMYAVLLLDIRILKKRLDKWTKVSLVLLLVFFLIGLIPTVLFKIQHSTSIIIKDLMLFSKFFICYAGGMAVFDNVDKQRALKLIGQIIKVSIVIIFFFGLLSIFVNLNMGSSIRYGIRSYQFLFPHYTYLVYSIVIMLSILTIAEEANYSYKLMAVGILILTLRSKAFVFVGFYFFLNGFIKYFDRLKLKHLLIAIFFSAGMVKSKIADYLSWGIYNLRTGLYIVGFSIANDYFPFGTGYGTYGSNLSKKAGSPIYVAYDLIYSQGFRKGTGDFPLSDVFWPYIIGQWGYIGALCFLGLLATIYLSICQRTKFMHKKYYIASLLLFFYLLIASSAEAIFTNETGVYIITLLSIFLGETRNKKGKF